MTKITSNISTNIPALTQPTPMHYKLHSQHVAQLCPYDRQSSCMTFSVTVNLYIWVLEKSDLCMEITSSYEGHTSCPFFSQLLHCSHEVSPSYMLVTQNITLTMSNPSNDISLMGSTV